MEDQRYNTTLFDRRVNRGRSSGIGRKKKMKSMLNNVGSQLMKCANSDNHDNEFDVIEYSLNRYQKNASEDAWKQKKMQKKKRRDQGRDDDELLYSSTFTDDNLSKGATSGVLMNEAVETTEALFDPFNWMWSPTSVEEENVDDRREIEGDEGYKADQEREEQSGFIRPSDFKRDEEKSTELKRRWRKASFRKNSNANEKKSSVHTDSEIDGPEQGFSTFRSTKSVEMPPKSPRSDEIPPKSPRSDAISPKPPRSVVMPPKFPIESPRPLVRSASRSSKTLVSGAKMVGKMPVKLVRNSSKLLISNAKKVSNAVRSTSFVHRRQARILTHSGEKTAKTSKSLASSIKRMVDANETKAASDLLVSVHAMMQTSEEHKTTESLLEEIEAHIRDTESKATRARKNAWRARRRRNCQAKKIESKKKKVEVKEGENKNKMVKTTARATHENFKEDEVQQARSNDSSVFADLPLLPSISRDKTEPSPDNNIYQSEYDDGTEDEEDDSQEIYFSHTDWDDYSRNSETSAYTTDFNNDYLSESDLEIEGLMLSNGFESDGIFSEESQSHAEFSNDGFTSGIAEDVFSEESESENEFTDDERVEKDRTTTVGYADTDIIDEDEDKDEDKLLTCPLSEHDQDILHLIEKDLQQLEEMHEEEKDGWLYRTFYTED